MANAWILRPQPIVAAAAYSTSRGDPAFVGNDFAGVTWSAAAAGAGGSGPFYHYLDLDLGAAVVVDTVMILGLPDGLPADLVADVQGITGLGGAQTWVTGQRPVYAGTERLTNGKGVSLWGAARGAAPPASRFIRLGFTSATRFDITVARAVVGARLQLDRNFVFGGSFGMRDFGSVDWSRRGVLLRQRGARLRTTSLSFSNARQDEVERQILPLLERCGNSEPVALVTNPAADPLLERRCYFGPITGDLSTTQRNAVGWEWKTALVSLF